ncbi:hypothetical protein [Pararhizobium gei]|uniref:hypothetical protein n=1 Tax=Pararhizobium gei TaxID=1395951 RepID=UPI0023DB59D2|nr:hypothetical protein [Rhizobium gei]
MNQRFDPSDNRNANPGVLPGGLASPQINPTVDPLNNQRVPDDIAPRSSRSKWPLLIILLAGVVLALLVWLPSEMGTDDTATPAATEQTTDTPAGNTAVTPDPTTTTPNATPATPDTQTPATGTGTQTPATGTAP